MLSKIGLLLIFSSLTAAFNVFQVAHFAKIYPSKVLQEIPKKIRSKYLEMDENDDRLTTSYSFPSEYKSTLYKDKDQKTTLVNVFPTVEVHMASFAYSTIPFQELETSITLIHEQINSTIQYQVTPMLNSTLQYPTTVPVQTFDYATVGFQHETLVYSTKINITEVTSTKLMNFTVVDHVDNHVPLL